MTTTIQFPNGESLSSSAQSPASIETLFQALTAQVLGFPIVDSENKPLPPGAPCWTAVRVGWQPQGQPAWEITEDVVGLTAYTEDHPFTRVQDGYYVTNDYKSLLREMGYTQVWRIHFTVYGPNAFEHAAIIVSAFSLDWVRFNINAQNIFSVPEWKRPVVLYENFQGQWWQRADVDLKFNEQVSLSTTVPAAASVEITLVKENNLSTTVNINI